MLCLRLKLAPVLVLVLGSTALLCAAEEDGRKKHHHHHHHHHGHHHTRHGHQKHSMEANGTETAIALNSTETAAANISQSSESVIINKMKQLEQDLSARRLDELTLQQGHLKVNAPLPGDFDTLFANSVSQATGCKAAEVRVLSKTGLPGKRIDEVTFEAPRFAALDVRKQAGDPASKLAKGPMHMLLVAKDDDDDNEEAGAGTKSEDKKEKADKKEEEDEEKEKAEKETEKETETAKEKEKETEESEEDEKDKEDKDEEAGEKEKKPEEPGRWKNRKDTNGEQGTLVPVDVDVDMPYGDLEPFGREDTAQELTQSSIEESNRMVDQLERAEVAEEKRAVFRALTRLRGAAITSFDGVARAQTGNIDAYNQLNKWRHAHPLRHLADEESDISKWAFPDPSF